MPMTLLFHENEKAVKKWFNIVHEQQVTWGHNIVADGWAGAAYPTPHPTPLPTQTQAQTASKTLVFPLLDFC